MAKTKINKIIAQLIKQLEHNKIRVQSLILFGSHASGKATRYSDIDIAVISPSFKGKGILKRQELLGEALWPLQQPIEAIGYTPAEYKNHTSPFLSEILATGRIIFKLPPA
jgi:predicted nucleotidyltransferase